MGGRFVFGRRRKKAFSGWTEMDVEFFKWCATLGVGGVIAGVIFMVYRKDIRNYTELWKAQSSILIDVVKENTSSNTKLVTVIEALQRRLDAQIAREERPK
jgi:hypothetical protein